MISQIKEGQAQEVKKYKYALRDLFSGVVFGGIVFLGLYSYFPKIPELFTPEARSGMYNALFTAFLGLDGFIIASYAIIAGYASSPLVARLMEDRTYPQLLHTFSGAFYILGCSAIVSLACMLVDIGETASWCCLMAISMAFFSSVAITRRCFRFLIKIGDLASGGKSQ